MNQNQRISVGDECVGNMITLRLRRKVTEEEERSVKAAVGIERKIQGCVCV